MSIDKIIRRLCLKQMCLFLVLAVVCGIIYVKFIPEIINGHFDAYDSGWCIISAVVFSYCCYIPISNVWHLLTGRYEYYTEETEVNKFYRLGDKKVSGLMSQFVK